MFRIFFFYICKKFIRPFYNIILYSYVQYRTVYSYILISYLYAMKIIKNVVFTSCSFLLARYLNINIVSTLNNLI